MDEESRDYPDLDIVSVVYDCETEVLSLDFDETKINNFTVLGMLVVAARMQKDMLSLSLEEEDET